MPAVVWIIAGGVFFIADVVLVSWMLSELYGGRR
jgi:hypothetical protein